MVCNSVTKTFLAKYQIYRLSPGFTWPEFNQEIALVLKPRLAIPLHQEYLEGLQIEQRDHFLFCIYPEFPHTGYNIREAERLRMRKHQPLETEACKSAWPMKL